MVAWYEGSMAKYLRFIDYHFANVECPTDDRPLAVIGSAPESWPLRWMYEHLATPLPSGGVSKVNIYFTATTASDDPSEVLGIATVHQHFDPAHFFPRAPRDRQRYFLEQFHCAMLSCADHFGWDRQRLVDVHRQIIERDFRFTFFWKKPLASLDRRVKAQPFIDVSTYPTHLSLIFFDRKMHELRRTLLSVGTDGPGAVEFALGDIRWIDANTIRIQHQNERDYWLCTTDGDLQFCYPRADHGDPHGQYDLGRMYFDGQWVLQDRIRGLQLIEAAAQQGFKHAIRFLASQQERDTDSQAM
jgi:hypothetical protein